MNVDLELIAEIKDQLQNDILDFGWLCQIARLRGPHDTAADCVETVVDAVTYLRGDGTIIVGSARETDGMVRVEPWPERDLALGKRIKSTIDNAIDSDRDFCFWIQLSEHAARN